MSSSSPYCECDATTGRCTKCQAHCTGLQICISEVPAGVVLPAKRSPVCLYIGKEIREEYCSSCRGRIRIKVFHCSVHKECALSNKLPNVVCCPCESFVPKEN